MRICVVGAGYVGLVTAACLADAGNDVRVVERHQARVTQLRQGRLPIFEPGLLDRVQSSVEAGRLHFTTSAGDAVPGAEVVFLCVGTPTAPDGGVDMTAFDSAAADVAPHLDDGVVIASKSTVPVGSHLRLRRIIEPLRPHLTFDVVSNPEFLKEGAAVEDFLRPSRVVVGTTSAGAEARMRLLYAPFVRGAGGLVVMDPTSAELTKYACNAMLAVRISFINEIAALCERVGADVEQVRRAMGSDPRIGPLFLSPSLGYGGSCLPKDVDALALLARESGAPVTLVEAAAEANTEQRRRFVRRLLAEVGEGARVAVWGLAFKAGTDDVRASPAIDVVRALRARGIAVVAHDPEAMDTARAELGDEGIEWVQDPYDAVVGADALVVCTEWTEYRILDLPHLTRVMRGDLVMDGRNLYDRDALGAAGLRYIGIGKPGGRGPGADGAARDRRPGPPEPSTPGYPAASTLDTGPLPGQ